MTTGGSPEAGAVLSSDTLTWEVARAATGEPDVPDAGCGARWTWSSTVR